ncbi:hypothetical protein [Herbiconiux daphne]|uniref:Uncharacterized protein n=1 Tax=Herbiconiux daphne TaxID=2970914 RepID=A0ABT2HAD1_9MICO|nr:hypothetical protein [Herbiconiux daphne]MCS5736826.1 hypothetical protein [Herbiconiux daphne]
MKLLHLEVGDEFKLGGIGDTYKLVATDDNEFMQSGDLVVENQRTGHKAKLPETTEVTLINVV